MALHWFGKYLSSFCSLQDFFGFSYPAVSQVWRDGIFRVWLFMPAAGARPKEAKINLMDCISL